MNSFGPRFRPGVAAGAVCVAAGLLLLTPAVAATDADSLATMPGPSTNNSTPTDAGSLPSDRAARPIRGFSLTPHRGDRCRLFLTAETSGSRVNTTTMDKADQFIVTNGIGLMMNVNDRWAMGGALDLAWARGHIMFAPALRCRRWFAGTQSVEASLAFVRRGRDVDYGGSLTQLDGPMLSLRYAPTPGLFVHGGVCQFREQQGDYQPPDYGLVITSRTYRKSFVGLGLTGVGGVALWGVELIGLAVVVGLFAGMGN